MQFRDISQDRKNCYTLGENERVVFFMLNRTGAITFELTGAGAEAHIFSFFIGKDADQETLTIFQKHCAAQTASHTLVKSVLFDEATYTYEGLIHIDKKAVQSDASQESRSLLLSPQTQASMKPILEILADDVRCHHAATVSPLNPEALFFAKTRGLSEAQAKNLLVRGFFNEAIEKIQMLGGNPDEMNEKLETALKLALP